MRRDVLVIAHSQFPWDPRIRKQVDALRDAGMAVDVVCLRGAGEAPRGEWRGARVFRLPVRRRRGRALAGYALEYAAFAALAGARAAALHARHRYRVVQVHNLPDPLVFSALVPRLAGARVLLDIHDFMPELFQTRLGRPADDRAIRLLRLAERLSTGFAHGVLTTHETGRRRLIEAGVPAERICVVMNTAPMERPPTDAADGPPARETVLLYHGLLSDVYDLPTAVDAMAALRRRGREDVRLWLVGDGPETDSLRRRATDAGVADRVRFEGQVDSERIPDVLARAHVGYAVLHQRPHQQVALPTKMFECLAAGLPVVTSATRVMRDTFGADGVVYVEPGDAEALATALTRLTDATVRRTWAEAGRRVLHPLRWEVMRERYTAFVERHAR